MEPPGESDRRNKPRAALVLKVEYPSRRGFLNDFTTNISCGGTMIRSRQQLSEGDPVRLMLSFPGLLQPVQLSGAVVWVKRDGSGVTAGVSFDVSKDCDSWRQVERMVSRIATCDEDLVAPAVVRILVVEDNPVVADLIHLGLSGYVQRTRAPNSRSALDIQHARDGAEALERVRSGTFELLITDLLLPVIDGAELIRQLRSERRFATLPIIAVSAAGEEMRERALVAGADFFLSKPLRLADLVATIRRLSVTEHVPTDELPLATRKPARLD